MTFSFPSLADPLLESVDISIFIEQVDFPEFIAEQSIHKTALSEVDGRKVFVGFFAHRSTEPKDTSIHVHIRFADERTFEEVYRPKPNASREELVSSFEMFRGKSALIRSEARFVIPLKDVPDPSAVRPLLRVIAETADVKMRMTGGRFSLQPRPLFRMSWFLREEDAPDGDPKKAIVADIVGYESVSLDDDCARRILPTVTKAFDVLILGSPRGLRP